MQHFLLLPIRLLVAALGVVCLWMSWQATAPLTDMTVVVLKDKGWNVALGGSIVQATMCLGLTCSILFLTLRGTQTWREWKAAKADDPPTLMS